MGQSWKRILTTTEKLWGVVFVINIRALWTSQNAFSLFSNSTKDVFNVQGSRYPLWFTVRLNNFITRQTLFEKTSLYPSWGCAELFCW